MKNKHKYAKEKGYIQGNNEMVGCAENKINNSNISYSKQLEHYIAV